MAQDQRSSDAAGPMGNPFAMNGIAVMQQMAQSAMRGHMEVVGLASRRARAQMEFTRAAMNCHSPAVVGQLGSQFWHDALQDYTNFNHKMMSLWIHGMAAAGQGEIARETAAAARRFEQPMTQAAEETVARMSERPIDPWSWWVMPGTEAPRSASSKVRPSSEPRTTGPAH